MLTARILHGYRYTSRNMGQANGGLGFVDVLASFSAGPHGLFFYIFLFEKGLFADFWIYGKDLNQRSAARRLR